MEIVWKPVIGYEQYYKVASDGSVVALKRTWVTGRYNLVRTKNEHTLAQFIKKNGYMHTQLTAGGIMKQVPIHTIVASAFLIRGEGQACVNHKDGNKLNNSVNNLEWASYKENNNHALKNGLRINPSGINNGYCRPIEVYKDSILIGVFPTIMEASRSLGVSYNIISKIQGKPANKRGYMVVPISVDKYKSTHV